MEETRYFRRGLGHRAQVVGILHADYHSGLVEFLKANGYRLDHGDTTLRLAREFGFCYGVDRAVEYAYEARDRFPDRTIWLTGEIIHNPGVNRKLAEMGVRFLRSAAPGSDHLADVGPDDVVIIPAFGVTHEDLTQLRARGSILVDTTCGSVLTVWKSVERFARAGITSVIHGKVAHEETRATCSQVTRHPGAHWLVVRDREEALVVCELIEGRVAPDVFLRRFSGKHSPGFDPERDLRRLGCANQTTMLSSESLEIAEMLRAAVARRDGGAAEAFHSFDTICSATQERQDAVLELVSEGCDLMVVIGGFNSSNTNHLVEIASRHTAVRHIEDAANLVSRQWIRHKPLGASSAVMTEGWLPEGPLRLGVTAGASTPDSEIGESIARLLSFRGIPSEELERLAQAGREAAAARRERERARLGSPGGAGAEAPAGDRRDPGPPES
jgi:4-hydroxy-3-methylbut-2-enyl diphosphate reductase